MRSARVIVLLAMMGAASHLAYCQSVVADSTQKKTSNYFFVIQTGALLGDKVTFSSSTIHGIKLGKRLRAGAGVGFNSYEDAQVLPLFGSMSLDLFGKKNTVFVQMDYGWAPWAWSPGVKDNYGFDKTRGGETFSAMIGYRINYGDVRLALMAGYKHQEISMRYTYPVYYYATWNYYPYSTNSQEIEETMNRFAISLSVGWR